MSTLSLLPGGHAIVFAPSPFARVVSSGPLLRLETRLQPHGPWRPGDARWDLRLHDLAHGAASLVCMDTHTALAHTWELAQPQDAQALRDTFKQRVGRAARPREDDDEAQWLGAETPTAASVAASRRPLVELQPAGPVGPREPDSSSEQRRFEALLAPILPCGRGDYLRPVKANAGKGSVDIGLALCVGPAGVLAQSVGRWQGERLLPVGATDGLWLPRDAVRMPTSVAPGDVLRLSSRMKHADTAVLEDDRNVLDAVFRLEGLLILPNF